MAIQPKTQIPLTRGQRTMMYSASFGTSPASINAIFKAMGLNPSGFWIGVDDGAAANLNLGSSSGSQPIALKAAGDIWIPSMADEIWVAAASGTVLAYVIGVGT